MSDKNWDKIIKPKRTLLEIGFKSLWQKTNIKNYKHLNLTFPTDWTIIK